MKFPKRPIGLVLIGGSVLALIAAAGVAEALKAKIRPWMQHGISSLLGTSGHLETRMPSQLALPVQQNEVSAPRVVQVSPNDLRYWISHYMGQEIELAGMHCTPKDQGVQCFSPDGLLGVGAVLAGPASAHDILRRSCTQPDTIASSPQCIWTIRFTPDWQQDHAGVREGKVLATRFVALSRP